MTIIPLTWILGILKEGILLPKMHTKDNQNKVEQDTLIKKSSRHFFVDDLEHPYNDDENKFNWIRGYHVGGRSLTWGRHTYRLSEFDFEANLKDGIAVDWPIRYKDIAPWYDYVEQYIGVQGRLEGLTSIS
jgi:choline dehydrogenase-like flavoprotein